MSTISTKTKILSAQIAFTHRNLIKPLRLSSGPIYDVTEAVAEVIVSVEGKEAKGRGAIYLSDLWSWPDPALPHEARDSGMRDFCTHIADNLVEMCGADSAHPLNLGMHLHNMLNDSENPDGPPALARLICGSPFDAAIHDAAGQALGRSAFALYEEPFESVVADSWFKDRNAGAAILRSFRKPITEFDAWLIVGSDDTRADIAPWVLDRHYRCFKLKLPGRNSEDDVQRTVEVYRIALELGAKAPRIAVDTNCANPNAASMLDYLERLRASDEETFNALAYVEQPTGRDITHFAYDWRPVTRLKPVILDEGLMSMDRLALAVEQGWSGIAFKTCRGHSFSLVAAAYAHENGMLLAMQDLTNPGIAAIHAALCAAHLPVFNGMELNSPQYTPEANSDWLPRLSALLEPIDGCHRIPSTIPVGLGSTL